MRMKPYFYKVIKAYQSFSTAFIWSFLFLTFTSINSEEEKKIPFVQQIRILTFREWSCRGCTFMATHQPFLFMNSLLSSLFLWLVRTGKTMTQQLCPSHSFSSDWCRIHWVMGLVFDGIPNVLWLLVPSLASIRWFPPHNGYVCEIHIDFGMQTVWKRPKSLKKDSLNILHRF